MDLLSRQDLLEPQGDGPDGHRLGITTEQASVLASRRIRELHHPAGLLPTAGGFVETHMAIAAQPQQLNPDAAQVVQRGLKRQGSSIGGGGLSIG